MLIDETHHPFEPRWIQTTHLRNTGFVIRVVAMLNAMQWMGTAGILTRVPDDVRETFRALGAPVSLGLISNGVENATNTMLHRLHLGERVRFVVTGYHEGCWVFRVPKQRGVAPLR